MPFDVSALQEAFRRRGGQQPNTSGIPGGAAMANQITPENPLAALAQRNVGQAPGMPTDMSSGAREQLPQSKPGEAELIVKALIQRLRQNPPAGAMQAGAGAGAGLRMGLGV